MDNDDANNSRLEPLKSSDLGEFGAEEQELIKKLAGGKGKYVRLILAALGTIPWFGVLSIASGVMSATGSFVGEKGQEKNNELLKLWLQEHRTKAEELATMVREVVARLDQLGDQIDSRIQSPEYLTLVKSVFRSWDAADTSEKKEMLKKLITNAGVEPTELSPDDLIRLFINWINQYHEAHFLVIREIFQNPGITRHEIWDKIHHGGQFKENSMEADLFKYLIDELSIGHVIRQTRRTHPSGKFYKDKPNRVAKGSASPFMKSALGDGEPYELTELGAQFVHYVMKDIVLSLGDDTLPNRE